VTQEVFLRLWNQPDRFDPSRGSLRSFLLAQTHGRAVDAVRSSTSRRLREARDAMRRARSAYDMQHEAWDLALADQVTRAMEELPDDERRAIELAYFDGRTYREVARLLDQPEGTIKSRIRNGMRRMRTALGDAGVRGVDA
jgi:RNA polymerase sigma-70 factor (ECF subfamily)